MRRYRRYPIFATAVIADKSSRSATPIETMVAVANLSIAGMGIYSFTPLEKGKAVSIDITFVDEQKSEQRERIEGRIVWSTKKDGLSFMGIVFDEDLNPAGQPILYEYFRRVVIQED